VAHRNPRLAHSGDGKNARDELWRRLEGIRHIGVLQRTSVVYLDKAEANRRICAGSKTGTSNPVYCTSLGKAMLAYLPPEAANEIIDRIHFVRFTSKTIGSREELMNSLERVRRRGYGVDDEEIELGVRCVGAPIFDENHMPIAAISVSGPTARIQAQTVPVIAQHLIRCCSEISATLRSHQGRKAQMVSTLLQPQGIEG
jgi:DNA-binding IclR family transcriptional regulator